MTPHRGVTILVFGILSLMICQLFGIPAWIMGNTDLNEMAQGRMDAGGRDLTKAGRILGMVGTGVLVFQLLIIIAILVAQFVIRR